MLIVNNSMPKSGSSLLRYYVVQMIRNVKFNGQALLVEMIKNGDLEGRGSFVRKIDEESIHQLVNMSQEHGPILIKVHLAYSNEIEHMLDHKEIFITYTYRDPRDMLLSAMDHHKRVDTEFVRYTTLEESIPVAAYWAQQAILWKNSK